MHIASALFPCAHNCRRVAKYGEGASESSDLYFAYGKALLENAISQTAVLGKDQAEEELLKDEAEERGNFQTTRLCFALMLTSAADGGESKPFISFSGDAEEDDKLTHDGEDTSVDLFAEANATVEEEESEEEAEGDEDGEPEDDFNAAWEVLDLARALYDKRKDEDEKIKLKLADTYITLGDVSLETGMHTHQKLTILTDC